jgi:hypothetical protein
MTAPTITHPILKTANQARHLALLGLLAVTASASAQETVFGTDNDGFGGFTSSTTAGTEVWSETADSVNYAFGVLDTDEQRTASLLQSIILDKSEGKEYSIEGVVDLTAGYGDDNNRIGILLFNLADSQTADGGGGLWMRLNTDNNETITIDPGINGTAIASTATGVGAGDTWIGQTLMFNVTLTFKNDGTDDRFDVSFTLTDGNDVEYTVAASDLLVSDYPGTYCGFATKWRQRGDNASNRNVPVVLDYRSFSIADVSPPTAGPFTVTIAPNTTTPGNYDFTWTSQPGKEYDLVSSTDLATAIATWPVWDGRSALPATPPSNTLTDVPGGGDTRRFFAVVEKNAPALFSENFDAAAALPAGWTSNGPVNGTDWEIGVPSGVPSGPVTAFTAPNCAGTNIGGYFTENTNVSLVTPVITIPADTGATLLFRQLIDTDDDNGDIGSVRVLDADNADAPIAGLEITGLTGTGSEGEGDGWSENSLVMPALDVGGKNIKIEFNFVSDAGTALDADVFGGFYVDDVSVSLD